MGTPFTRRTVADASRRTDNLPSLRREALMAESITDDEGADYTPVLMSFTNSLGLSSLFPLSIRSVLASSDRFG